ncbi:MAG: alpha/beta fold hydrolase [Acidimicrobiales bacterium]
MASIQANGITVEYETFGNSADPPLLLVMGLGAQMIAWDDDFVASLAQRGFYVIRYDNRDVGLSTWFDEAGPPDIAAALSGDAKAPYLLADMADDAAGLLDALGIDSAHIVGASMGGMIVQSMAIGHPSRVRTLTSIMSTTGAPDVGQPHEAAMQALLSPPPTDKQSAINGSLAAWAVMGSPGYPLHEDRISANVGAAFDRAFHPEGTARQLVAIVASPDRTPDLKGLDIPTLVIHGESDTLVDPSGGKATADAVPGAELWMIPGVGHDLPMELFDEFADRIAAHCAP